MASEQFVGTIAPDENGVRIDGHQIIDSFLASVDIDAGEWVALDSSKSGIARIHYATLAGATPVATGDPLTVGVAHASVLAGALCPVVIEGYVAAAKCDDTTVTAAGIALTGGKTVAGQADALADTDLTLVNGFSLAASGATTTGYCEVWVCRRF